MESLWELIGSSVIRARIPPGAINRTAHDSSRRRPEIAFLQHLGGHLDHARSIFGAEERGAHVTDVADGDIARLASGNAADLGGRAPGGLEVHPWHECVSAA